MVTKLQRYLPRKKRDLEPAAVGNREEESPGAKSERDSKERGPRVKREKIEAPPSVESGLAPPPRDLPPLEQGEDKPDAGGERKSEADEPKR